MLRPSKGPRLGGSPAHERLILSNLATALFEHDQITTTLTKAKRLRPFSERLISFAKRGDLASRRRVMRYVKNKSVVHTLFTEIAPLFSARQGGYTRIVKIMSRKGDNAPMAIIELVTKNKSVSQATVDERDDKKSSDEKTDVQVNKSEQVDNQVTGDKSQSDDTQVKKSQNKVMPDKKLSDKKDKQISDKPPKSVNKGISHEHKDDKFEQRVNKQSSLKGNKPTVHRKNAPKG